MQPALPDTPPRPAPLLSAWRTSMRAQSFSERTVQHRVALVDRVARSAGVRPAELETDQVLAFLASAPVAASTRRNYHSCLRAWFDWLAASGHRADHPLAGVPSPRVPRRHPRSLTAGHVTALLSSGIRHRTRGMVLLMAYAGLRVSEVAQFRGDHVDLRAGVLQVEGKGGVFALLPLHPVLAVTALEHPSGWWFPQWTANRLGVEGGHVLGNSVSRIVGDAMRRAGIPGTAHSLRHWHATELLRQGVDSRVTQELMRHASLATTERYLHVDDTQRREALLRLPDVAVAA